MITKLVTAKNEEFKPPLGVVDYDNHYNHMPGPFREISWHDFVHKASIWSPQWQEFRQVRGLPGYEERALVAVRIGWYWFGGLGTVYPRKWRTATEQERAEPLGPKIIWEEPIRYFLIGCEHDWRRMTAEEISSYGGRRVSQHDNFEVCTICGLNQYYDSSG